jgi:hypothetical protein
MTGGPWIKAALFCERVVVDAGAPSAIGIFDHRTVTGDDPVAMTMLVILVRGDWAGAFDVKLDARSPSDEVVATIGLTVDLPPAPEASGQVLVPIQLVKVQDGVYWFELRLRGELATRVPLRIGRRQR